MRINRRHCNVLIVLSIAGYLLTDTIVRRQVESRDEAIASQTIRPALVGADSATRQVASWHNALPTRSIFQHIALVRLASIFANKGVDHESTQIQWQVDEQLKVDRAQIQMQLSGQFVDTHQAIADVLNAFPTIGVRQISMRAFEPGQQSNDAGLTQVRTDLTLLGVTRPDDATSQLTAGAQ